MGGNIMQMVIQMLIGGNNPNQLAQQLVQTNPQMKAIANQMKNSGMSPKQFLEQYAKQNNIDVNPIMQMLSKRGIKF